MLRYHFNMFGYDFEKIQFFDFWKKILPHFALLLPYFSRFWAEKTLLYVEKSKENYLTKNFGTKLRIHIFNIDLLKQVGYTMNQILEKIPKIGTNLRFLSKKNFYAF